MATLEQLAEGIKRAHAAGDVEAVKKLGAAYRAMQAEAPAPIMQLQGGPGTEGFAAPEPKAFQPAPDPVGGFNEFSNAVQSGFNQGLTFGFGDELYAGVAAPVAAAGSWLGGGEFDLGKAFNEQLDLTRKVNAERSGANPIASAAGEVTGAIVNPLSRISGGPLKSAATGAGLGAAYGFGTGETMDERLSGAGLGALGGGVVGAVAPAVAKGVGNALTRGAQRRATNAAIAGAPAAADLKQTASQMFRSVDNAGVTIDTNKFARFVQDQVRWAKSKRINPNLDPKATGAYETLIQALDDVQKNGGALTLSDMHTLRQIAQKAAVSSEGRDAMFAGHIVDEIDNFITQPGVAVLPTNRIGNAANAPNELLKAISTWGRAKRVSIVEEAIYKAQNAGNYENGLRVQFRQILNNQTKRKLFTQAEIQAMEDVVRGNTVSNAAKLLGMFGFNFGKGTHNIVGGSIGLLMGQPILTLLGTGARKVSEKMTERAAQRAAQVVATPNVPSVAQGPKTIAAQEALRRLGVAGIPALVTQN